MGSTLKTPNYELSQFVATDRPSWLGDYDQDMRKIDTAIADVKVTADKAGADADTAATSATQAEQAATKAQQAATEASASAATANTTATQSMTTANQAISDAKAAKDAADAAQTTANTANTAAGAAQSTANTAQSTANSAQSTATGVVSTVNNLSTRVDGISATIGVINSPSSPPMNLLYDDGTAVSNHSFTSVYLPGQKWIIATGRAVANFNGTFKQLELSTTQGTIAGGSGVATFVSTNSSYPSGCFAISRLGNNIMLAPQTNITSISGNLTVNYNILIRLN